MKKAKKTKPKFKFDPDVAAGRVRKIYPILKKAYPQATVTLDFKSPLELLISTVLAAQCTDERVNRVTPSLYKKYKSAADWAGADLARIEQDIKPTGFFRNKARSIKNACIAIEKEHAGRVPDTLEELVKLPGVGRKTANVILGNAFDTPGIVCDTHVIRLSRRLQLSVNSDPVKLEFDLMKIVPRKKWTQFSHLLVFLGRTICRARKPDCGNCPIKVHCPSAEKPDLW